MNMQNKRLGLFYIIVGTLFIADSVYLYFFSYDGEIFPMILFPMCLLAIVFIFKGFLVVFSSSSPSNQVIATPNQIVNSHSGIGPKALKSNLIVLPLIFILGAIILHITVGSDLGGLILVWFGGVASAIYFTLTVIIYTFSSNGTDSSPQSNKRLKTGFNILFVFTLFLSIASLVDYLILINEKVNRDGYSAAVALIDNLEIGSPLEVLVDIYRKNTDWSIFIYDQPPWGPTGEAFKSCGGDIKTFFYGPEDAKKNFTT